MTTPFIVNGTTYAFPATADEVWGDSVNNWASAVTSGMLQKAGGLFTLTAEVDLGATYSFKAPYFKSRTASPAAAGQLRLAKTDTIGWRNNANGADLALGINGADALTFGGAALGLTSGTLAQFAATTSAQLASVISDETGSGALVFGTSPTLATPVLGAATATSINKMTITAPATSSTLAVADGKTLTASNTLTFTGTDGSSVNVGTGGSVAYAGVTRLDEFAATTATALRGVITGTQGTGSLVFATSPTLTTPALGTPTALVLTNATGLPIGGGGTGQTTAAAAFKALAAYTAKGDLPGYSGSVAGILAVGADGTVLTADAASTNGFKWGTGLTNPMVTTGDMIYGGAAGAATKLATGATAGFLKGGNAAVPAWNALVTADIPTTLTGKTLTTATLTTPVVSVTSTDLAGVASAYSATDQLRAGRFTPTYANLANTSATSVTANSMHWTQIGTEVTCHGMIQVTVTAGAPTATQFTMTLPVPPTSNFALAVEAAGCGTHVGSGSAQADPITIAATTSAKTVTFDFIATASGSLRQIFYSFSYKTN